MNMEKELANGMSLDYLDESKKLAGDRWLVKLRLRLSMPLQDWMQDLLKGEDLQTTYCREALGDRLVHEVIRERNFIDEGDKEALLSEMVHSFEENIADYLQKETFVRQLFALKLTQLTEQFAQQARDVRAEEEDTPEPADFSACFR
jgi:hypothetical protein